MSDQVWHSFEGHADYYGDVTVIRCACGAEVSVSDEPEYCTTCGREYRRQVVETLYVRGGGNGKVFEPPPPRYSSIDFAR